MNIQSKFKFFIEYNLNGDSDDVKNAFTLNEANQIDISKALELGMRKDFLLRLQDMWSGLLAKSIKEGQSL